MNFLKRVVTAVVLIPVVLALVLKAPTSVLALMAALVALLSIQEFLKLSESYGIRPFRWPTYIFVGLFFLILAANPAGRTPLVSSGNMVATSAFLAAFATFLFLTIGMRRVDMSTAFPAALVSAFAFGYIALPMGFLVHLRALSSGAFLLLYLLVIVWVGDIFAYLAGKAMGRHLMSPRVSPKKTWEGAAASLLASVGFGVLLYHYALSISTTFLNWHLIERRDGLFALQPVPLWPIVVRSAVINVAAQLGDLVESLIKRGANVKDSGTLLPGHGGMLDRVDALLFAAPVLWYYVVWQVMQ